MISPRKEKASKISVPSSEENGDIENLRNMALDRYQGQEEILCFLGLALCTKMRIRKRRVSLS